MTIIKGMCRRFIKQQRIVTALMLSATLCAGMGASMETRAGTSKRIEVYAISQNFWDVAPGETLGDIVKQLLPDNPQQRKILLKEIVQLNPDAFSQSNPDNLKANIRLWLPNNAPIRGPLMDKNRYDTQSFSWGQVHRGKHQ
ncbi:MAG TPA: hypothetical protein ENJ08_08605 [Gammaproteobacteria bacterium]|nr:hypothetical protein [Gammaproteobacteria bacterium]